ncbi:aspartyl protease family protein At5g10770-like [Tasmannia lanceolata]|uniref:aspartyl protease family protein At5g10770-like n=1 Tax=Tasmannia lanceolata TaxID=3420 RepID=UPI004063CC01
MANRARLIFFLLSTYLLFAFGFGAESESYFHVIKVTSLLPPPRCSTPKGSNHHENRKGVLKLDHRYGPCSPLGHRGKPTLREILSQDQSRVNSLQSRFKAQFRQVEDTKTTTLPAHLGTLIGTGNYVVTIGLGTPKSDLTVVFDTGSNLNWVQCQPCAGQCYPQQDPIFDPSKSSTYLNISCSSQDCSLLPSATGRSTRCAASTSTCVYATAYGDGSFSTGYFARDTLALTTSDVFPNFAFGCGQSNDGLFGRTAGLLGLGRDALSLISQTAKEYGKVFSYCLPPTSSSNGGYLKFGSGDATSVKFTPLLTNPNSPSFYFLQMAGISVGGQQLNIAPSTFASPGTIIDSGTVITRLPMSAYVALRSAFREFMSNYTMAPASSLLDTCYDFTQQDTVTVPKIVLHFGGNVDVDVPLSGIFSIHSASQVCLAFAGNSDASDLAIFGNHQQQTLQVVYDLASNKVGFEVAGCT